MPVRLGDEAPNFTAETTEGTVTLYDYLGDGWGLLFSHPMPKAGKQRRAGRRCRQSGGAAKKRKNSQSGN